jgi:hypothetical protein
MVKIDYFNQSKNQSRNDEEKSYARRKIISQGIAFLATYCFRFDNFSNHNGVDEFLNIQLDGNKAKGYQVRQLRAIILAHGL